MSLNADLPDDRSEISKVYRGIAKEPGTQAEREISIFTVAFTRFGGIRGYAVKYPPLPPRGFDQSMSEYKNRKAEHKAAAWKEIQEQFGGYLKAREEVEFHNKGNVHFLKEGKEVLTKAGAMELVGKIDIALMDYKMAGY